MAKEELREELKIEIGNLERLNGEMKQIQLQNTSLVVLRFL